MTPPIASFRDLMVWQRAMQLAKNVYVVTRDFPTDERFGLTNQVRRAAVSVSSNIAEGHARSRREFRSFLSIARGSSAEVESQLTLAVELGFVSSERIGEAVSLCREIERMTASLIQKLSDK